ncbi:L,D-transpeptidase family protein [Candidatus Amarolinea dominans]|uniref:L,D-transpeptidase family protein n=1 Tax=Candidatus Amarolinea dominans TaxID=3140696 RepID=UPI003136A6AF|nr:L,D-transpeptidase family protein [Anaerolineae bacterium]
MPTPIRLLVQPGQEPQMVHFQLAFSAAALDEAHAWAPARLETGDGHEFDLGMVAAPAPTTWREQRILDLADHAYDQAAPARARLTWGEFSAEAEVTPTAARAASAAAATPTVTLTLRPDDQEPLRVRAEVAVHGLAADHRLRLDAGAEQVHWLTGVLGIQQTGAWTVEYPKPGDYWVAVDWLDRDGFWLGNLTAQALTIADPVPAQEMAILEPLLAAAPLTALPEVAQTSVPWQPYRYARPAWNWARTYAAPGSSRVVRSLAAGTYLAITAEAWVHDALWYRSAGQDWVPASAVTIMTPSSLAGVELGSATTPPPPPPPPSGRRGVVTASVLNVRARPGVFADNPVIDRLLAGAEVNILEQATVSAAVWYRIGERRWVHSGWVRLLPAAAEPASAVSAVASAAQLPVGWVVSTSIYVRSGPGTNYAQVGEVTHNQRVNILESASVGGATWYRIGEQQWVYGQWVGVARGRTRPAAIRSNEYWVAVSLRDQTAVAYEGDRPVYAALVATGLPGTPTVQGIFRTWLRRPGGRMAGGRPGAGYYYLEEVVWTAFFYSGYALHSAYWHDAFGRPRSHGCVNLSMYDSWWLYNWSAAGGARSPAVVVTAA